MAAPAAVAQAASVRTSRPDAAAPGTEAAIAQAIDHREFRRALGRFATGVTVVTTRSARGKTEGVTVNSFSSVSLDPPLVLWCLQAAAPSAPSFLAADWFAINVLAAGQHRLSRHFSTSHPDKFAAVPVLSGLGECPILPEALACFECRTDMRIPAGDHVIFVGRVARLDHREGEPLVFSAGRLCVPTPLG
jgi:flavin reductase (DIM6/NTAB) family NADH-FMN oxidoreductase RutF